MSFFKKLFGQKKPEDIEFYVPEGMEGVILEGIGMHWAGSCKPLVESALSEVTGIEKFIVEPPPNDRVFVLFNPSKTNLDAIGKAIKECGFDVKKVKEIES